MLAYFCEDGCKDFHDYDTIEEKNKIIERFHELMKRSMREDNLELFKYVIVDFKTKQSIVYEAKRKVAETFEITGF